MLLQIERAAQRASLSLDGIENVKLFAPTNSCSRSRQFRFSVVSDFAHMRYSLSSGIVLTQNAQRISDIHVLPDETLPSSRLILCSSPRFHIVMSCFCLAVSVVILQFLYHVRENAVVVGFVVKAVSLPQILLA